MTKSVSVLTLNVWSHYLVRAPQRASRLQEITRIILEKDYDIICIQELFLLRLGFHIKSFECDMFVSSLKKHGYFTTDPNESLPSFFGQNSGVLIFSKYPIEQSYYEVFTQASITEYTNNKGYVAVDIDVEGTLCTVCTAHLDAHNNPTVRNSQLEQITAFLDTKMENPILLMGDLNICPRCHPSEYQFMETTFNKLKLSDLVDTNTPTHISGATLDHVFSSPHWKTLAISSELWKINELGMLSDHYAIEISLQLS